MGGGLGLSSRYGLAQPLASGFERGERGGSPPTSLGGGGTASLYRGSLGSSNCLSGLGSGLGPLGGLGGGLLGGGLEGAHQQKQTETKPASWTENEDGTKIDPAAEVEATWSSGGLVLFEPSTALNSLENHHTLLGE